MKRRLVSTGVAAIAMVALSGHARVLGQRGGSESPLTLTIVKRQLSNGLHVRIVEQHDCRSCR